MTTVDLLDGTLYAADPEPVYAWLREHAPVYRDEANGLWGISRHRDVRDLECAPHLWSSATGSRPLLPAQPSMIDMDDPEHLRRRRLVYRRFTPRAVAAHEPWVRAVVQDLVDALVAAEGGDAVADLAAPLPARVIGGLLGLAPDRWPDVQRWSETTITAGGGPRYVTEEAVAAAVEYGGEVLRVAAERRECPADDLLSVWVQTDGMDDGHLIGEALLLLDGGAETTRTVIATAVDALARHPEQYDLLRRRPELLPTAVEEFIRWTTPVLNMARSATRDVTVAGVRVKTGDEVLLMYGSANRDERVFDRPAEFDVTRRPNPHLSFGLGTHFCLGAALARLEIRVMFEELLRRVARIRWADQIGPRRQENAFVRGITAFPVIVEPG